MGANTPTTGMTAGTVGGGGRNAAADRAVDIAVVLVTCAFSLVHDWVDQRDQFAIAVPFDLLFALPLLLRRRFPFGVFGVTCAIVVAQLPFVGLASGGVAVLVALYSVGVYERRRWAVAAAAAISLVGTVGAALRWAPSGHLVTGMILLAGTVTAAWVLGVYVQTRRDYLASVLARAATAERDRDSQARLAAAGERARISREMHDIVAHSLSVLIALSDGAAAAVDRSPEAAKSAMANASALGRQALGDVRRLLGASPGDPDQPVALNPTPGMAQLDELVAQVRGAGLSVELVVLGRPLPMPPGAQLAVYRMVQEALTNVLKHAPSATRAVVTVRYGAGDVDVEVENDGEPVDALADGTVGRGLTGMQERAAIFSGSVQAARLSTGGWRVASHLRVGSEASR